MKKQRNTLFALLLCAVLLFTTAVPAFAAPGAVKNLKAAAVSATAVTLKWKAVSGASGYEVQQASAYGWQSVAVSKKAAAKVTNLHLGTIYRFRVRAYQSGKNGVQYGTPSAAISVTAAPTVKKLKASAKTSHSLTLKWSKASGAAGYRLQRYTDGKWVNVLKSTQKTSHTVKKLAPNTNYQFRVCAYTSGVFGAYQTLKVRTNLLEKPTSLKAAKVTDTTVKLEWNKVETAKQYYVYRVGTNTQKLLLKTAKTTVTLTKLKAATDYMYAVRARTVVNDRNYYSQFSSNLSVRTAPKGASGLATSGVTDSAVNLRFSRVKGAEGYEIWRYDDAKLQWVYVGAASATTYTVADLSPQTTYRFKIRAYHTANGTKLCGAFSPEVKVTTLMAPVSGLQFSGATGTTLTFQWNPISTATGYRVDLRELDESSMHQVTAAQQTVNGHVEATISSLKTNTSYVVSVRPVFSTGMGTEQILYMKTAPAKLQGVQAKKATGGITLSWPAAPGAEGYEVSRLVSGNNWTVLGNTGDCAFADSNVTTDTTYTYRVRAYYEVGDTKCFGEWSDPVSEKPMPPAVAGLAAANVSETSFLLSWNTQVNANYQITISEDGGAERTLPAYVTVDGGTTTLLVEQLNAGATYTVRVYNTVNGTQSMPAELVVTTMPGKVTGLTAAAAGADAIQLSWVPVCGAQYYEVQCGNAGGGDFSTIEPAASIPYTAKGLNASTEYTFRVRAVNSNGGNAQNGVFSDTVKAKTNAGGSVNPGAPVAPTGLTATDTSATGNYSVSLSWNGVNGVAGYRVSINDGSWRTLGTTATTTYTASNLTAGQTYSFRVESYTGSDSTAVYSNPSNVASVTLGGGTQPTTPTDPTNPSTPAANLPTSNTPITGITVKQSSDGRNYTLRWEEVSGAFYTVQMLDPKTNQWITVREKLTSARVSPDFTTSEMGVSCSTDSDQATTAKWTAVSGATGYEVRNEFAPNTNDWISAVQSSTASATLRLPPNSSQTLRISAVGPVKFRIFALNSAGTSAFAYSEYTATNAYLTSCDYTYQTPAAPAFSAGASAGVKEAYALMMVQAINNTRMETGRVNLTAVTTQKASASALGSSENTNSTKTITCQYNGGTGTATVKTQEDGKPDATATSFSMLQTILVPSSGATYLYDQHRLSTFQTYVSDILVSQSGGKTTITMKLKPEDVTTTKDMVYHPGLVGAAVTSENLQDVVSQSALITGASAKIGATTIQATINGSYTLDKLDINNPYTMTVSSLRSIDVKTDLSYQYTFTR